MSLVFDEISQIAREHYEDGRHRGKALFGAPDVDAMLRDEGARRVEEQPPWEIERPVDPLLALPWVVDPDLPAGAWELRDWPPE